MIFAVNVINNTQPAVSVQVADAGEFPLTYNQIKNSLGNQVYNIQGLYLYSNNLTQLLGVIQYQKYDSSGEQAVRSIALAVDPYQASNALNVDLRKDNAFYILNGNSSVSFTLLANTNLTFKMYTQRIKNTLGGIFSNFKMMEEIFKPHFYDDYLDAFKSNEQKVEDIENPKVNKPSVILPDKSPLILASALVLSLILISSENGQS